jgi:hypothetical protein
MTLLYRAQHPARYEGRLRTIPSSDVELKLSQRLVGRRCARGHFSRGHSDRPASAGFDGGPRGRGPPDRCHIVVEPFDSRYSHHVSPPDLPRRDTALEAFRPNPVDGSIAPPAGRPSA